MSWLTDLFTKANKIPYTTATRVSNNITVKYPEWDLTRNTERYCTAEDLYSVISFLATTAAMVPIYLYDKNDEIIDDQLINFALLEEAFSYLLLSGEVFLLKERPENGVNAGKTLSLKVLQSDRMSLKTSGDAIVGYEYMNDNGTRTSYEADDIIFSKTFNPTDRNRGLNPLKVLLKNTTTKDAIDNVTLAKMRNGGVDSIVYEKGQYENAAQLSESRKDNFFRFISNPANAGAPYFANGDMGVIQLGSTLSDLQVIEAEKISFKKVCNVFKTSDILFNSDSSSTESNVKEMIKRTYTNSILPNIKRVIGALNEVAEPGTYYKEDLSGIPELQEDMTSMISALATAWWLDGNEKREAMNYGRKDDIDLFNEQYIIPANMQLLDDLKAIDFPDNENP